MDWGATLLDLGAKLLPWAGTLLMAILGRYVFKKGKNDVITNVLQRAAEVIGDVAKEVSQVYVDEIKKGRADGVLTDAEKKTARSIAIQKIKSHLGDSVLKQLISVLGGAARADAWIDTKLEAVVRDINHK